MTGTAPSPAAPRLEMVQAAARSGGRERTGDPGDGAQRTSQSPAVLKGEEGEVQELVLGRARRRRAGEEQHPAILTQTLCSLPLVALLFLGFPAFASLSSSFHFPACTWAEPCVWKGCCLKLLREQLIAKPAVIDMHARASSVVLAADSGYRSIFDAVT